MRGTGSSPTNPTVCPVVSRRPMASRRRRTRPRRTRLELFSYLVAGVVAYGLIGWLLAWPARQATTFRPDKSGLDARCALVCRAGTKQEETVLRSDTLILGAMHCTVDNSHIFSAAHCGYPSPGYPGPTFVFTPFFTVGSFSFTKPMLLALVC